MLDDFNAEYEESIASLVIGRHKDQVCTLQQDCVRIIVNPRCSADHRGRLEAGPPHHPGGAGREEDDSGEGGDDEEAGGAGGGRLLHGRLHENS